MMFGGLAFGAGYFGGAPRTTTKTITGTGACTLAPATCSATGTAPSHGGTIVTIVQGGGFFPPPPGRRITGTAVCVIHPPVCVSIGRDRRRITGSGHCHVPFVGVAMFAVGTVTYDDGAAEVLEATVLASKQ